MVIVFSPGLLLFRESLISIIDWLCPLESVWGLSPPNKESIDELVGELKLVPPC